MNTLRPRRQICAFIDVLGGATLFQSKNRARARTFLNCLEEFERRMNGWSHHFPMRRQATALVKTFSDNVFVAFPFGSNSKMTDADVVHTFLRELKHQIHELTLFAGFPVRGAVCVGGLVFTDKFLFGSALVNVVALEKTALFPRVLLDQSVLKYLADDFRNDLVVRDIDGQVFLHYLGGLALFGSSLLSSHRDYVRNGLLSNASHVRERQKYEWLAQYHNFSAKGAGRPDLTVDIERYGAFAT